jgi:hypothetical protein
MNGLFDKVKKKDDDARLFVYENKPNAIYLESELIPVDIAPIPPPPSLIEEAATTLPVDMHVRGVYNMFIAQCCASLACLALGMPFYYWGLDHVVALSLVIIFSILFGFCYLLMIIFRKTQPYAAICIWFCFVLCGIFMTGCTASLIWNVSPFQLMMILWTQSIVVIVYTLLSPRTISAWYAFVYMCLVSIVVWGLFIYAFVVEHDWNASIVILSLGLACTGYQAYAIHLAMTEYSYGNSWEDIILSVITLYGDPVLRIIKVL